MSRIDLGCAEYLQREQDAVRPVSAGRIIAVMLVYDALAVLTMIGAVTVMGWLL